MTLNCKTELLHRIGEADWLLRIKADSATCLLNYQHCSNLAQTTLKNLKKKKLVHPAYRATKGTCDCSKPYPPLGAKREILKKKKKTLPFTTCHCRNRTSVVIAKLVLARQQSGVPQFFHCIPRHCKLNTKTNAQ